MRVPWLETDSSLELDDVWRFFMTEFCRQPAEESEEMFDKSGSGEKPYISSEPLVLYSPHAIRVLPGRVFASHTCSRASSPRLARSFSMDAKGNGRDAMQERRAPE